MYSKYTWVVPIKDKKGVSIVNAFQKIIPEERKWVDQGSEFYNSSFKDFLKINNIEMYSRYNEGKSVIAERFIRTLKNKIFKHMTAISKNVYFDVLLINVITLYKAFKMKPIDVMDYPYSEYNEDLNKKILNLKLVTMFRISTYKKIFAKGYAPN